MRNLTIKRTKSFVACLMKMKVYIEDPFSNETVISGVSCRKLGELKNGEEKTFQIDNNAAKIFVIADKVSKNYCSDIYELPYGEDDIYLTGKNQYNPVNGNAFRFDGVASELTMENRKKGMRKGIVVLVAAFVVGIAIGIVSGVLSDKFDQPAEETFSSHGMNITLTEEFEKAAHPGYTVCFESYDAAVLVLEESFNDYYGLEEYTLEEYINEIISINEFESATPSTEDGLNYFEYSRADEETLETYHYYAFAFKTNDAFWFIQFGTLESEADDLREDIFTWAKSISFAE